LRRFGEEDVLSLGQKTWQDQPSVARSMASEALSVIYETYGTNPTFFSGKSAKGIVGGLFYLLGRFNGNVKTQKEIARSLGTTEMTIRASYRTWVKPFQNYSKRRKKDRGRYMAKDASPQ
jgi:transcription initiation factor TFIIIB Brf1 subunit/transcription initiation factor TFIIB